MMALVEDPFVQPVLLSLIECMRKELRKAGGPGLCDLGVVQGLFPPLDVSCGDDDDTLENHCGGRGWARLRRVFPSTSLPAQDVDATYETGLAAELEIGVARCVHVFGDPDGNAPTDEQALADTALVLSDMTAMYRALRCCFEEGEREFVVGQYEPIGGGAVGGGTWSLIVRVK
jgi:hypothetical protein